MGDRRRREKNKMKMAALYSAAAIIIAAASTIPSTADAFVAAPAVRRTIAQISSSSTSASPRASRLPRSIARADGRRAAALSAAPDDGDLTPTSGDECDVLVLGSGPAARAIATLLAAPAPSGGSSFDVLLADANYDRRWIPNYGVWQDEWESVRSVFSSFAQPLGPDCIDRTWDVTDCFFGGSFDIPVDNRMRLDRPYCRVDRDALRRTLSPKDEVADDAENGGEEGGSRAKYRVTRANHVVSRATSINIFSPPGSMAHDGSGTTALLRSKDGEIASVRAKLVVDCTGHETRVVRKDDRGGSIPPGFQIAYGVLARVDETDVPDKDFVGPYYKEAMTLFDYRTDHFPENSSELSKAENAPTFMYAMPLDDDRIFFEETSLVARPAVSFRECKERFHARMEHLGIKVTDVEEEEFCYIPMGGPLPARDQRVVGFGGAAAMVHPSTGYHICRAMMGAGAAAGAIREELSLSRQGGEGEWNPDRAAARAYDAIWPPSNVAQRNFAVFGGEFLMKQKVEGLRGFFDGFFRLEAPMWGGFLAGWPGLPGNEYHETWYARLVFGLTFVSKLPPQVALDMLGSIVAYSISEGVPLPQSVTPLLGLPMGYGYKEKGKGAQGDVAAKAEARAMIAESSVEDVVPVDFEEREALVG